MYESHPVFIQPEDDVVKVWRYMDFTKFVSLLDTRRLFFARADKLGDPFEGSWPITNVAARQFVPDDIPPEGRANFAAAMSNLGNFTQQLPRFTAVNCWHINEHESAAMWSLYLKSDEGIAIQSRYDRFRDSILDDQTVHIGLVRYIDYNVEGIDASNLLGPFVYKRKSFEHEREVRAVLTKWPSGELAFDFNQETITGGVPVRTDIERLVEKVYVAPNAPEWFGNLVRSVIQRYGYAFPVEQSEMNQRPVY